MEFRGPESSGARHVSAHSSDFESPSDKSMGVPESLFVNDFNFISCAYYFQHAILPKPGFITG